MMRIETSLASWRPQFLSLMRIAVGLCMLQHGTAKFLKLPPVPMFANLQVTSLAGIAGVFELVCGALVVVGLFTRPASFFLSGLMAAAYFIAHAPSGFYPILNGGELAIVYCFVFLYMAAAGGGPWSLDAMLRRKG